MLEIKIEHFIGYCKVSNFAIRSIQSLKARLKEFNHFINKVPVESVQDISYRHLKEFVTQYRTPSIHIKKARTWSLRQFFHFLKLNGWIKTNIASDFPYPKIEKTIPHFLTIEEYNSLLAFLRTNKGLCFYPKGTNGFPHGVYKMSFKRLQIRLILINTFMPIYSGIRLRPF